MVAPCNEILFEHLRAVSLLLVLCFSRNVYTFMDMEELKSVYYGLSILSEPVVINKETPMGTVHVTSKFGQQYQCSFPDHSEAEKKKEEEEKVAVETGIVEMLKPMHTNDCLIKTKDWWTYEFCYGKSVRQYHMEDGKIKGLVINLGFYESDFDWSNETAKEERLKNMLASYHSQMYTRGDQCDLTGLPRKAEVRFMCEENSEDYLYRIEESETCVYTVTIMTSKVCRHPFLKPPVRRKAVPITCNPLLTADEFHDYVEEVNGGKSTEPMMDKDFDDALAATAKEILSEPAGTLFPTPDEENQEVTRESFRKMFGSSEQLWELYQKGLQMSKKNAEERKKKMEEIKEYQKRERVLADQEEEDAESKEDEKLISEFSQEISDIKARFKKSKNKLAHIKQKLANENWETNIKNVIKEAEEELGVKLDRTLVSGLSSTLNKLVNKLQDTEAELSTMDEEIDGLKSDEAKKISGLSDGEGKTKTNKLDNNEEVDDDEEKKRGSDVTLKGEGFDERQMEQGQAKETESNMGQSSRGPYDDKIKSPPKTDHNQDLDYSDQKLQVPSTFPLPKDPIDDVPKDTDTTTVDSQEDVTADMQEEPKVKVKMHDLEGSNIRDLLEESVRKEIEKKMIRKGSNKLALDDDHSFIQDKSVHVIQHEDKDGNTNKFIFVLGFKNVDEEAEEMDKQSTLEENYEFVYKKKGTDNKS